MKQNNLDVRIAMMQAGLKQFQMAALLGISETMFSRWMKEELSFDKKQMCFEAISKEMNMNDNTNDG